MNKQAEAFLLEPGHAWADYQRNTEARIDAAHEAERQRDGARVGISRQHESAHLHVAGQATYIDDMPELAGTLHAALGLSPVAHGLIKSFAIEKIRAMPGVIDVITAADIPGVNDCGPILHDDPILADGKVQYLGQTGVRGDRGRPRPRASRGGAGQACAGDRAAAGVRHGARGARGAALRDPAVAPGARRRAGRDRARAAPARGHGHAGAARSSSISRARSPTPCPPRTTACACTAPRSTRARCSTWWRMRWTCTRTTCTSSAGAWAAASAARNRSRASSRASPRWPRAGSTARSSCGPDRDDDFMVTGRRHGFDYRYDVGFDDEGRILGADIDMIANAGYSADLSGPVITRALCHFDNAYWLPDVAIHGYCAKTHTQSNTAFRGFGGPQGAFAVELIIDSIARRLGKDPMEVRRANFYGIGERDVTPYLQRVTDNVILKLTDELCAKGEYDSRRAAIAAFNASSPVLKKGPGADAGEVRHLVQREALQPGRRAGARLRGRHDAGQPRRHRDGPGAEHQGGAGGGARAGRQLRDRARHGHRHHEGGQHLGHRRVHRRRPERQGSPGRRAPDPRAAGPRSPRSATAARPRTCASPTTTSTSTACRCRSPNWSAPPTRSGCNCGRTASTRRPDCTGIASSCRAGRSSTSPYGAALSEVVVDTLTGEWKLLRADVLHDAGRSLNPAIDIGQVEGAFIQGMGWLTMEELVWHPKTGLLLTHAPSTYKIPTANDCPPVFNVNLFENDNAEDSIHRSKAVGEPPLLLPFSVFLAIRDAVSAAGDHRVDPPLRAPATCEAILDAIDAVREAA